MKPFNDSSLLPPPIHTYLDKNIDIDLKSMCQSLEDMVNLLSYQQAFHLEGAILSRLIYKYDKKFRHDIGFKNLKKVNTAMRKYLTFNLLQDLETYFNVLSCSDSENYLPTRQMLQYVLVRLQSFSLLMLRICNCTKKAAVFYMDRIKRGESHWMSLLPFAVLSRIWSISIVLLKNACKCYSSLIKFLNRFELRGVKFLSEDYEFPTSLENWLDLENMDAQGTFSWSKNKCIEVLSQLPSEETDDIFDIIGYVKTLNTDGNEETISRNERKNSIIQIENSVRLVTDNSSLHKNYSKEIVNDDKKSKSKQPKSKKHLSCNENEVSYLSKNSQSINTGKSLKKESNILTKVKDHSVEFVTSNETLKKFIVKEDKLRAADSNKCLTQHLSFMQWQSLKSLLTKLHKIVMKDKLKVKKFQSIWQEKCLDYL